LPAQPVVGRRFGRGARGGVAPLRQQSARPPSEPDSHVTKRKRPAEGRGQGAPFSVKDIVELAALHDLAELEDESAGTRMRVGRGRGPAASNRSADAPMQLAGQVAPVDETAADSSLVAVEAPMVGTFYRASSPGAAPFVSEGEHVKEGQVLCIIEAMKLMN